MRLAAALDLTDPRMVAVLYGAWGALAPVMRGFSPAHLLLVNPPAGIVSGDGVSVVRTALDGADRAGVDGCRRAGLRDVAGMLDSLVVSIRVGAGSSVPRDLPPRRCGRIDARRPDLGGRADGRCNVAARFTQTGALKYRSRPYYSRRSCFESSLRAAPAFLDGG